MRQSRWYCVLALCTLFVGALSAPAFAGPERNPHARTVALTCPFGQVTGTAVQGSSLLLEDGGVAVLHGLVDEQGQILGPINQGLLQAGKLVVCTYFSERLQQRLTAYVQFVP